ncbi:averantin oxidoreductase, partial [Coniella lustricola]
MATAALALTSFAVGVGLHVVVFRHGEWDLEASNLGVLAVAAPFAVAVGVDMVSQRVGASSSSSPVRSSETLWVTGKTATTLVAICILGIYTSMLVYRAFFHRLGRFPGPFGARLSHFWIAAKGVQSGKEFAVLKQLHGTHGDVVRLGPQTLSICDPRALEVIHGAGTKCTKAPWYNCLHPMYSLLTDRVGAAHRQRRKAWEQSFSTKSLRVYEPRVAFWTDKLLANISAQLQKPVNMGLWLNFYSFDVMGDLSLGESFGMLDRSEPHWVMHSLHAFMISLAMFSHCTWMLLLVQKLPVISAESAKFKNWVAMMVDKRMKNPPANQDLYSFILDDFYAKETPTKQERMNLNADGVLSTIAGSDTTAAALTCLFAELATHPTAVRQIQQEVDSLCTTTTAAAEPDNYALSQLPYLQACLNEVLRLYPAVPSGIQRFTPPGGLKIGDDLFIPGDTIVQTPQYVFHRDARNFPRPDEFIPERWTTQPELIQNGSVYSPFSIGKLS